MTTDIRTGFGVSTVSTGFPNGNETDGCRQAARNTNIRIQYHSVLGMTLVRS